MESSEAFLSDINSGRWDQVLPTVAQLKLPRNKLEELYEQVVLSYGIADGCTTSLGNNEGAHAIIVARQVVLEMVELREIDTARAMLRQTQVFTRMRQDDPDRLLRLERLCGQTYLDIRCLSPVEPTQIHQAPNFCGTAMCQMENVSPRLARREVYGGTTKEKRRAQLAHSLSQEVTVVPPSRLMALIGQALKWCGPIAQLCHRLKTLVNMHNRLNVGMGQDGQPAAC